MHATVAVQCTVPGLDVSTKSPAVGVHPQRVSASRIPRRAKREGVRGVEVVGLGLGDELVEAADEDVAGLRGENRGELLLQRPAGQFARRTERQAAVVDLVRRRHGHGGTEGAARG